MPRTRTLTAALLLAALAAALAGCTGDAGDTSSSSAGGAAAPAPAGGSAKAGDTASQAAAAAVPTRTVRTAELTVKVAKLDVAAARIRAAVAALGGYVAAESSGLGAPAPDPSPDQEESEAARSLAKYAGNGDAALVLRVPEQRTEAMLQRIGATGTPLSRRTSAEDVTARVADLDSRVASQTKSLDRVRALLGRAGSLQDVVLLESELAKREADLESLQAQQRSLRDRAALATVTAVLRLPPVATTEPVDLGFLSGLENGWTALVASVEVLLTVLGAVLPFAVVLALLAVPALLFRRRVRRRVTP